MKETIQLRELKNGQKAVITGLTTFDDMRRRLQDIGLIEGTVVECVGKSPLGDPAAYLIRGAVIALRSEDSGRVMVDTDTEAGCIEDEADEILYAADTGKWEEQPWG